MITSKLTKQSEKFSTEEKVLKLLEGIDWKLWEIYNMMKDNLPEKPATTKTKTKTAAKKDE